MNIIRVTKEFRWEMSHALWQYDGLCKNIHGHSYIMQVTVKGSVSENKTSPTYGMVIDFGTLKSIVNSTIVTIFDHSLVLYKESPHAFSSPDLFERLHILDFQPTAENLVSYFAKRITEKLPKDISLYKLRLYETATSFAEWYSNDNL